MRAVVLPGRAYPVTLPAVWVTPLLQDDGVVAAIAANPAPQLLVCGRADPLHDAAVATRLLDEGCEVLELPGLDHALSSTGDGVVTPDVRARVSASASAFVGGLA